MPKPLTPARKVTINAADTAEHLSKSLGGKQSHWAIWLANDRKPSRVNRRLPQEPGPGRPRYDAAVIDAYIAHYKKEYPELGNNGKRPGSPKNQRFTPHISAMTLAEGADQAVVLFVIAKPLATFKLSAEEARQTAARLIRAADEIEAEANANK